ncbi:MAG TPA: hypothetical protein VHB79_16510 [Polyangiaceae bacterium]|nr:hypothetical protein [Polyangiaceae bacterium]
MSSKSLWIGPAFGIALASGVLAACSGDVFRSGSSPLDHGGSEAGDTGNEANRGGNANNTPKGGTGSTVDSDEGGAHEVVATGGGANGGMGGGANGGVSNGGVSNGGVASAGSGGVVVDPPEPGAGGDKSTPEPPIDPSCAKPIVENWSEPLSKNGAWYVGFGDPKVETAQHRLVLSYDDVAERTAPYAGSYYAESDVTIAGKTVFTPYPYCFEVLLPSLRRDATGGGIELGATQYAGSWSTSGWGGASGTVIAGTTKLHVAYYVQATSKKFALKVSYGDKTYRSTWVTDFHWDKTDLSIMRYVGENNSSVYAGSDAIYVDPVSGCQGLSDAAVAASFEN